jgi:hypothetical protein
MSENPQETIMKPTTPLNQKDRRTSLFQHLNHIIELSHGKVDSKGNSDRQKQAWGRLLVAAIACYGNLLNDTEMEDIEERLAKLEEKTL